MQASTQQKIVYFLILQWKQESAIKRVCFTVCPLSPTLEENLNVPRWPTDDVGILAKLGWIWSWLQCAAHGSQNCVFNNDSNSRDP